MIYELWNLLTSFGEEKIREFTKQSFGNNLLGEFNLDPKFINVNHGSHGSTPNSVMEKVRIYQEEIETNPDKWFNYTFDEKLKEIKYAIGEYVNTPPANILLLNSSNDGAKYILNTILTERRDKILILSIADPMIKAHLENMKKTSAVEIVEINISQEQLNLDEKDFIYLIENFIKENLPVKVAYLPHISAAPAMIFPVEKLLQLTKKYNIISIIDGSQVVGQINLDLSRINPDYYLANFHEWGFAPKSSSMLFIGENQKSKLPLDFVSQNPSALNSSSWLAIEDGINFIKKFGDKEIKQHIKDLAWKAAKEVSELWKTEILIKNSDKCAAMINVLIPCNDKEMIYKAVKKTFDEYNTYIFCFSFDNKYYARFSAQIYNQIDDFIYAGNVFLKVLQELRMNKQSK